MRRLSTQHPKLLSHRARTAALMIVNFIATNVLRARLRFEFRRNRTQANIRDDVICDKAGGRSLRSDSESLPEY